MLARSSRRVAKLRASIVPSAVVAFAHPLHALVFKECDRGANPLLGDIRERRRQLVEGVVGSACEVDVAPLCALIRDTVCGIFIVRSKPLDKLLNCEITTGRGALPMRFVETSKGVIGETQQIFGMRF